MPGQRAQESRRAICGLGTLGPVNYKDLQKDERLTLAGLLQAMIRLDHQYSREESTRLRAIADELGDPEAFWESMEQATLEIASPEQLKALTSAVTRPEARGFILEVLESLSAAGGLSTAEDEMIKEVAALFADEESGPYR